MKSLSRRAVVAGSSLGMLVSRRTLAAGAPTTLVIYSAFENGQIQPLVDAFHAINPNITISHFHQPGEELLATISLELRARSPKADVVGLNDASLNYLQSKFSAFEPYAAPDAGKVTPALAAKDNIYTPAFINLYLIHFNTRRVSMAEAPKSWADLLQPRWRGMIAMADPKSSQSIQSFIWFIADYLGRTDPATYGWDYFHKLAANDVQLEASHGTIRDLTVSGERPVAVQLLANAQTAATRGEPTSNVWPAEGAPGEVSGFAVVKGSPKAEAAKRWLDFILTPPAQVLMPASLGGAPVRTDVPYRYPDGTPLEKVKVVPVDSAFIAANGPAQTKRFAAAMGQ